MTSTRDTSWWPGEQTPDAGPGRWVLPLIVFVLLVVGVLFVVALHFAPSVGASGGCGGA